MRTSERNRSVLTSHTLSIAFTLAGVLLIVAGVLVRWVVP